MSDSRSQPNELCLLHIAQSFESPEAVAVENSARQCGIGVERCGDVYVGLARALKNLPAKSVAVVVCVAGMPPEQFEFFELTSGRQRDLTVLVYSAQSPERVVRALQAGASGLFSHEAVCALAVKRKRRNEVMETPTKKSPAQPSIQIPAGNSLSRPGIQTPTGEAEPEGKRQQISLDAASIGDTSTSSEIINHPSAEKDSEESRARSVNSESEEQAQGVRVPWLRYNGGPARRKPGLAPDPQSNAAPPEIEKEKPLADMEKACGDDVQYEPLLTEQELAALLADDFDDVSTQERQMLTGENDMPGSSTR